MQHVAVDVVGTEVLQRAGHGLGHLSGKVGGGVVGQPVILAALVSKLRLQEEVRARDDPCAISGGKPLAHAGLEVVPALIGRVDPAEACPEGELGEGWGALFLPRGAVEEINQGQVSQWKPDSIECAWILARCGSPIRLSRDASRPSAGRARSPDHGSP